MACRLLKAVEGLEMELLVVIGFKFVDVSFVSDIDCARLHVFDS